MTTDRIEKTVMLKAPRARVWRAIANAEEFGAWFGVKLRGPFVAGKPLSGTIELKGNAFDMTVEVDTIQPESLFSYRWHPYAVDPKVDYSSEPMTLVELHLEDANNGTKLTIIETGFDRIPLARRAEAFRMNDGGWTEQAKRIERYVSA